MKELCKKKSSNFLSRLYIFFTRCLSFQSLPFFQSEGVPQDHAGRRHSSSNPHGTLDLIFGRPYQDPRKRIKSGNCPTGIAFNINVQTPRLLLNFFLEKVSLWQILNVIKENSTQVVISFIFPEVRYLIEQGSNVEAKLVKHHDDTVFLPLHPKGVGKAFRVLNGEPEIVNDINGVSLLTPLNARSVAEDQSVEFGSRAQLQGEKTEDQLRKKKH